MRCIIAGSRDATEQSVMEAIDACPWWREIREVVSGCCRGADQYGEQFARLHGIPVKRFPADWNRHGKAAGPIRNREMAEHADALIAIHAGQSRGTANMISEAEKRGLRVYVYRV